ncbi:DUF6965 family protein [Amniculibacterium aquaticum]|uniref:DUF6965 family protein n=1 Tax=Amniculibacterium aquaticum TaxID=2479858 RepID=UPI000F5B4DCA|nr:hypothetical protein [Amniculibacterium aquaticum]
MKNNFLRKYLDNLNLSFGEKPQQPTIIDEVKEIPHQIVRIKKQPPKWDKEISELETYFDNVTLPKSLRLNKCSIVNDCNKFVKSHLSTVKSNNGNRTFTPYLNRLQELRVLTEQNH